VWRQNHALAALSLKGERGSGTHLPGVWGLGLKADMDVVVKIAACVRN